LIDGTKAWPREYSRIRSPAGREKGIRQGILADVDHWAVIDPAVESPAIMLLTQLPVEIPAS